ncbi:MAG: alpha/beta fold hydrolase [Candidatus Sericytochromatia bacterium]|nr:alpha/beta fold hydrolase [Candidatus Sericytochromatia bacterium]
MLVTLATSAALALPPTQYQRARTRLERWVAQERLLPLQRGAESRLLLHPDRAPRGTLVMYHGFTAGTWQYDLLAGQAFRQGYNVFVPRMPGHGLQTPTGDEDPSGLLRGGAWRQYQAFGDETVALARALGGPLAVLGLSVGGNVALDVAERHPDIANVVAYAPFLWPIHERVGRLFGVLNGLDAIFPGRASSALDGIQHSWGPACRAETLSGARPGHSYFPASAAFAAAAYGLAIEEAAPRGRGNMQLFVTAADDAAQEAIIRRVHERWGGRSRGLYRYGQAEGVPHPMVHPREDRGRGHTPTLYRMTLAFLASGVPLQRDVP